VLDLSILEWNLEALAGKVERVAILAGDDRSAIESSLEGHRSGLQIDFIEAGEMEADDESSLRLQGETLYDRRSLERAIHGEPAALMDASLTVRYPWNLLEANVACLRSAEGRVKGEVEQGAIIKGDIVLEEGALIKAGCYIEGPVYIGRDCVIGPFAHLRPDTIIESACEIGKSELYDCLVMRGTTCKHQAYIGHSVVGEGVNIGAGLISADYRHDAGVHVTPVDGRKIDTGRRKLGAFIGDRVHTGIGTLIYPGRKI